MTLRKWKNHPLGAQALAEQDPEWVPPEDAWVTEHSECWTVLVHSAAKEERIDFPLGIFPVASGLF